MHIMVVFGQNRLQLPVTIDGKEMSMDWNGGFNAPQFSNIDLNRDGIKDLISFDRQGDILRTYLRMPASGRWVMDWSYLEFFPPLVDWVLAVDYDKDGVEDLFTSSSVTGAAGITVYKGAYENGTWSFTLRPDRGKNYLQVPAGGDLTNLYVAWDDIPALLDVDNDQDLDILVFEPGGSYIAYYANQSVESGWGTDSLRFLIEDVCWGKILENELSETVYLSDDPDICSDGNLMGEEEILPRHAGSTISALDVDFDRDKDAFVGDITSRRVVFLLNGLDAQQAWIVDQDSHFPSGDVSVDMPFFVGTYFVELDDDPEPELLAAINSRSLTEDVKSVWRYDDDPLTDGPYLYELSEKGFLQNEMIDLGSHSRAAIADVTGDGLPDAVMAGYKYVEGNITRLPYLWLFENQGSIAQPHFVRINDDYLGMSQYANQPTFDFAPAFGDTDGNGTIDLVVGDQNGKLFYYRNTAAPGEAMVFSPAVYPFMNIAVGVSATPQIVDINADGLGDLVIGERTGNADQAGRCSNLNYFENVGSTGMPVFNPDPTVAPNTQCFGRVLFDLQVGLPQFSAPSIVRTQQGLVMMTGSDPGKLLLYSEVEKGKTTALPLLTDEYGGIDVGNRSSPALADLNHDGVYELIVGNQRGGLELYSTDLVVGYTAVDEPEGKLEKPYTIQGTIGGTVDMLWMNDQVGKVQVYDMLGRMVNIPLVSNGKNTRIDFQQYAGGMYILNITVGQYRFTEKILVE
jgi:hypothetical protein